MFATKNKSKSSRTVRLSRLEENISPSNPERTQLPLSIITSASLSTSASTQPSPRSSTIAPKSPKSNSIRRAFSTSQNSTLNNLFDKNRKKQDARHAFVFNAVPVNDNKKYLPTLDLFQDYVLRHAAVISIEAMVSYYSIDDLLGLLEENLNKNASNNINSGTSLWRKLKVQVKMNIHTTLSPSSTSYYISSPPSSSSSPKVFGVPITDLVNREKHKNYKGATLHNHFLSSSPSLSSCYSEHALIPIFIKSCISALFRSDVSKEGIFRKNGNIRQLRELTEQIDKDTHVELNKQTAIQLAALLKRYLRELPEPLLTFRLYDLFTIKDSNTKLIHLACCLLPKANRDTMLLVFGCLKWVSSFSDTNKMDIANLARVIAPSVLFSKNNADPKKGAQSEIKVVQYLIQHSNELSMIPDDLILLPIQDFQQQKKLNSRSFMKQYTQLLQTRNKIVTNNMSLPTSPTSPTSPTTSATVLSLNLVKKPLKTTRRASWIPGRNQ